MKRSRLEAGRENARDFRLNSCCLTELNPSITCTLAPSHVSSPSSLFSEHGNILLPQGLCPWISLPELFFPHMDAWLLPPTHCPERSKIPFTHPIRSCPSQCCYASAVTTQQHALSISLYARQLLPQDMSTPHRQGPHHFCGLLYPINPNTVWHMID